MRTALILWMLLLFCGVAAAAQNSRRRAALPGQPAPAEVAGVTITTGATPRIFRAHNQVHLAWELMVRNGRNSEIAIESIEVGDGTVPVATYEAAALRAMIRNIPDRGAVPSPTAEHIRAGETAVIFFWLDAPVRESLPDRLTETIHLTGVNGEEVATTPLRYPVFEDPIVVGPPFSGASWVAGNGPSNDSPHRRAVLLTESGSFLIAQRYAIDWIKVNSNGSTFSGDRLKNTSYFAYGTTVNAMNDGVVASIHDGMAENVPGQLPPVSLDTAAGNFVILDLGRDHFALYAHLQPGSLRVAQGDHVTRGQPLGLLGNSGNSTEPHLHLHICDANTPLVCEGLPYAFDRFATADGERVQEIPLRNDLVTFP